MDQAHHKEILLLLTMTLALAHHRGVTLPLGAPTGLTGAEAGPTGGPASILRANLVRRGEDI